MVNTSAVALGIALLASIAAFVYNPLVTRLRVFGLIRQWNGIENFHAQGLTVIPDLFGVEDLHYHEPTGIVFGLTEESIETRKQWFPPYVLFMHCFPVAPTARQKKASRLCRTTLLTRFSSTATFTNATNLGTGSFFMLLPHEDHATRLSFEGFTGPFITHGFDIATSPSNDEQIYFIAVNHLPNPLYRITSAHDDIPKARSQIEIFSYTIGETSARHLRSIVHPLIRTPNDIFAVSPTSFYVTNDHRAREGFSRLLEDSGNEEWGAVSDLIHVSVAPTHLTASADPAAGLTVTVAMSDLQNPNGLGHGRTRDEIMLVRAASGILSIVGPAQGTGKLEVKDKVQLPSCLDNPVYFHDPYAKETGRDASGFVLAGLAHAISWPADDGNPVVVWLVQPPTVSGGDTEEVEAASRRPLKEWSQKMLFMDDGRTVNSASIALLVAIPPEESGGRKLAWLIVTGPIGVGVWRTKVEL